MPDDAISLEGMVFYAYHGVGAAERQLGQRFIVDVEIATDVRLAASSDDLNDTVNYSAVYDLVREVVQGRPRNLIEGVANEIAEGILGRWDVEQVRVKVTKPEVPIRGSILSGAAVQVVRRRRQTLGGEP